MIQPGFRYADPAPAVHSRERRAEEGGNLRASPQCVDQAICIDVHLPSDATIADRLQASSCDHSSCDSRIPAVQQVMDPGQIRDGLIAKFGTVRAAAEALGIEANHLTKHWGSARRKLNVDEMDLIRAALSDESVEGARPVRSIPWLGDVPASDFRAAEEFGGRRFLVSDPETPVGAYALTVKGDSMDLIVPDGASIVIDPDDTALWPGRRYVVMTEDGDKTFKEFQADPARLIPCSSNPTHSDILLGREPIKILGRVFSYTTRDAPRRNA